MVFAASCREEMSIQHMRGKKKKKKNQQKKLNVRKIYI